MAGKVQKPYDELVARGPAQLARRDEDTAIDIPDEVMEGLVVPPAPPGLSDFGVTVWATFWGSMNASYVDADGPAALGIGRWCQAVDQRETLWQEYQDEPLVEGQRGIMKTNPAFVQMRALDALIARYEDQYGLTPLAQMRLGIEFLGGKALEANLRSRGVDIEPKGPQRPAKPA
jgi:hypothetical protein